MQVDVHPTAVEAASAAAAAIARHIDEAVTNRGVASLALSGGTTPLPMVESLRHMALPWDHVHLFQVDERQVPVQDAERNWSHLHGLRSLLPGAHCHPMPVESEDAPDVYTETIAATVGRPAVFDVVHLGLGSDGHTASLAPGDPAVEEQSREVLWVLRFRGHRRLTLTLPVLTRARHQVWLVTGGDKADAVSALVGHDPSSVGARAVRLGAEIYLDIDAASRLSRE